MKRFPTFIVFLCAAWAFGGAGTAGALDPPHNVVNTIDCHNCHMLHNAPGGTITKVEGNPNLCMSCHNPSGLAAARPFADVDQAYPGQAGTSHRFDSGPSGHVEMEPSNTSTGEVMSGGDFTGRIEKSYTITIATGGETGAAAFDWVDSDGNNGSGTTGIDVPLSNGLTLTFTNGSPTPSFVAGDTWTLYVRTDLRLPILGDWAFEDRMARRVVDGKVVCSVCHDQHSQRFTPADPGAPAFGGSGTGWGRHYQRRDNDANQMCHVCHEVRNVQSSSGGSHPVGVPIPASSDFQLPASLDLVLGNVNCTTCHNPHFTDSGGANGGAGDGYLLNDSIGNLCYNCHTLADQGSGSHFNLTSGLLWPGGQYGSTFPAHTTDKRGRCVNCHWPHGWPDDDNASQDYPRLWVEQYDVASNGSDPDDAEDLCFTCHDGSPAGTDIRGDFLKGTNGINIFHHPVMDSEQSGGRSVECVNCHNPHRVRSDDKFAGVAGVDLAGNPVGYRTSNDRQLIQWELCFNCHGDTYNSSRSPATNKRLDFQPSESAFHPVTSVGRNQSTNLNNQLAGAGLSTSTTLLCTDCHNSDATTDTTLAADSAASTKGPHGSTNAYILRKNYNRNYTGQSWNNNNAELCFHCHSQSALFGNDTNFNQPNTGAERDNLHDFHLQDKSVTSSCASCHFNIHSNRTASNTVYRIIDGGTTEYTSPPLGYKTRLVNFAPDVQNCSGEPGCSSQGPVWQINIGNRRRACFLRCHGGDMDRADKTTYEPNDGEDDDPLTFNTPAPTSTFTPAGPSATPTVTPTATPTDTPGGPTATPTSTPTITPTITPTDTPTSAPTTEDSVAACEDNIDNDGDGDVDCHDIDCWTGNGRDDTCIADAGVPGDHQTCCANGGSRYACWESFCDGDACNTGGNQTPDQADCRDGDL